jgi:hypothetical protein
MFEKGQHVKILLINNSLIEGIIEDYNSKLIKLKSLYEDSFLFIHHPERDIIMTKIMLHETNIPKIEQEIKDVIDSPSSDLRIKKLAELRIEMAQQEKKIISEKLKDHEVGSITIPNYSSPFIKGTK